MTKEEKMEKKIKEIVQDELRALGLIPDVDYDYNYNPKCSLCNAKLEQEHDNDFIPAGAIKHESVAECIKSLLKRISGV